MVDDDAGLGPEAPEIVNGRDSDCDGITDDVSACSCATDRNNSGWMWILTAAFVWVGKKSQKSVKFLEPGSLTGRE